MQGFLDKKVDSFVVDRITYKESMAIEVKLGVCLIDLVRQVCSNYPKFALLENRPPRDALLTKLWIARPEKSCHRYSY